MSQRPTDWWTGISIHAPTRGATALIVDDDYTITISIHAPTRGATKPDDRRRTNRRFQSTLPREERLESSPLIVVEVEFQSTLPREERRQVVRSGRWLRYFNPRSHERSDIDKVKNARSHVISIHAPTRGATNPPFNQAIEFVEFQSTLPREERLGAGVSSPNTPNFNPRSHERSDILGASQ